MISKLMEKCSSSTTNLAGSACRASGRSRRAEAVIALRFGRVMVVSPLIEPAHVHKKRPGKQYKRKPEGEAGKNRWNDGNNSDHQGNHLPDTNRFAAKTVWQVGVEPGKAKAGGDKGICGRRFKMAISPGRLSMTTPVLARCLTGQPVCKAKRCSAFTRTSGVILCRPWPLFRCLSPFPVGVFARAPPRISCHAMSVSSAFLTMGYLRVCLL